jgi:hypothetical protein
MIELTPFSIELIASLLTKVRWIYEIAYDLNMAGKIPDQVVSQIVKLQKKSTAPLDTRELVRRFIALADSASAKV